MSNFNSPFYERVFIQPQGSGQSALLTIPNTSGTWNNTTAQLIRVDDGALEIVPLRPLTPQNWKGGSRSMLPGIVGRSGCQWTLRNIPIAPSGTAGTKPDADALWAAIFGQAATVVSGTSVTYNISDQGLLPFCIWSFYHGLSTVTQRCVYGCVPTDVTLTLNGPTLEMTVTGVGVWQLDNDNFANEQYTAGLTAWPAEPSSVSIVGSIIPGFGNGTGSTFVSIDGNAWSEVEGTYTINFKTGYGLKGDFVQSTYPALIVAGARSVSGSFMVANDDSANLIALKNKAKTKAIVANLGVVVGTGPGYFFSPTLYNLQVSMPQYSDQDGFVRCSFGENPAHIVTPGSVGEITIAFT